MAVPLLDDQIWNSVNCRNGDGSFAASELAALYKNPSDITRFREFWPYLCSECTTWSAAYPAAPHLLELAKRNEGRIQFEYLYVLALFRMNECEPINSNPHFHCLPQFRREYEKCLKAAIPLLAKLSEFDFGNESHYYLSALATLKGHPRMGAAIESIVIEDYHCPECGELIVAPENAG